MPTQNKFLEFGIINKVTFKLPGHFNTQSPIIAEIIMFRE